MRRDPRVLLADVDRAGEDIERFIDGLDSEAYVGDKRTQAAVERKFEIIGEALNGHWGWQFGGHHLAINGSFADGRAIGLSPTFVGVEPASFQYGGVRAAPLRDELAAGRAVMQALPEALRTEASISRQSRGVEAGAGEDGLIPEVRGSAVAGWPDKARALLLETIGHWVLLQPRENGEARMAELKAGLDDLHFAWNGPHEAGDEGNAYFRIQGPTLIIEFSTEGGIAADGPHFHSIYRNPTNEYGTGIAP